MLMRQILVLVVVATFSLVQVESRSLWDGIFRCSLLNAAGCEHDSRKLRHFYDGIDFYLRKNLKTEDVAANMKVIEDWKTRESTPKASTREARRLLALIQLHHLVQTEGPGRCTLSSSRILENNDVSLRGAISKLVPGEIPKRRIERLVNYYANKFTEECDHEIMIKEVDPKNLMYVTSIVGDYVSARARDELPNMMFAPRNAKPFVDEQPKAASNFAKSMKGIRPIRDSKLIHSWLKKLAEQNFDHDVQCLKKVRNAQGQLHVDGNKVFRLFRRYLGKPCEQFVDKVESSFGSSWALNQSIKIHKRMNTEDPLYKNLAYFHGCSLILHHEEELLESLKAMIEEQN